MATQRNELRSASKPRRGPVQRQAECRTSFPQRPPVDGSRSRGEYAYGAIRAALRSGKIRPGQHLREVDVAAWLELSRTPVREAIRRLVAEGLLVLGPWNGALVSEPDEDQVRELYAVRESLEGTAAALAANQASPAEIKRLHDILDQEANALENPSRLVNINDRFHDALYRSARNRYLLQSLNTIIDTLGLLKHSTFVLPGSGVAAHKQHTAIVKAITEHDSSSAERHARRHVRDSLKLRLRLMRSKP